MHGRQHRCQEDPVSFPCGRLEKPTRSSPHQVAQHRPTGSETTPPYAPRSRRFGSELPLVEDDVDVWRYAIVSCMPETTSTILQETDCFLTWISCRLVSHMSHGQWTKCAALHGSECARQKSDLDQYQLK